MIFPIPDFSFWLNPSPFPHSPVWRYLNRKLGYKFYLERKAWIKQAHIYFERQEREAEEYNRYLAQVAEWEAMLDAYEEELEHLAERLPVYLHKVGLSYRRTVQDRKNEGRFYDRVDYCVVEQFYFDEQAFYFKVDTDNMPYGLAVSDFLDKRVAETLSVNFNSTVSIERNIGHHERYGLWVVVEHRAGRGIIPLYVEYSAMFKALPKTAPPLVFPVGVGPNGKGYYADMDEMVTVLIVGSRGAGKSNIINTILTTWLQRAAPDTLRLFLTDLKGGLEFDDYSGIPHLGGDFDHKMKLSKDGEIEKVRLGQEICTDPHQVIPVLRYLEKEMARRQELMRGKARKISAYNKKRKKKLSYWVLVIDELATLTDSNYAKDARQSLGEIARKGRAVGLFLVLATQIPDKSVLHRQVAGNMDCRIVGRVADGASSAIALGDGSWDAVHLPFDKPGRMIWRWADKVKLQAPYIPELTIRQIIKSVCSGQQQSINAEELAMAEELFMYSLDYLGGVCNIRDLFSHFRNRIGKHKISAILKNWENNEREKKKIITLGDTDYYLSSSELSPKGRKSRILIPLVQ